MHSSSEYIQIYQSVPTVQKRLVTNIAHATRATFCRYFTQQDLKCVTILLNISLKL